MAKEDVVIMSVSEASLLFGNWKHKQEELKNKKIVVVNKKNHRPMGAFQFIEMPVKVEETCPVCHGEGKVNINLDK